MGTVPNWNDQQGVMSPLREFEMHTASVPAFSEKPGPRRFARVPTHAVGVVGERRVYPRACLSLPLRLLRVGETAEAMPVSLVTRNISSSGIYFLAPREIAAGTAIELEVALIDRPMGCGRVEMMTAAHVVRSDETGTPGWHGYAASFDDFALRRDDGVIDTYLRQTA